MTIALDYDTVVADLKEIADAAPDTRFGPAGCMYGKQDTMEPVCIIGCLLKRHLPEEEWKRLVTWGNRTLIGVLLDRKGGVLDVRVDEKTRRVIVDAQDCQDRGYTWAAAVEHAAGRKYLEVDQ